MSPRFNPFPKGQPCLIQFCKQSYGSRDGFKGEVELHETKTTPKGRRQQLSEVGHHQNAALNLYGVLESLEIPEKVMPAALLRGVEKAVTKNELVMARKV